MTPKQIIENAKALAVVLEKHNFVITPEGGAPVQLAKIVRACIEGAKPATGEEDEDSFWTRKWDIDVDGEIFIGEGPDFFLTALTPQTPE